jgi:ribonuclease HI
VSENVERILAAIAALSPEERAELLGRLSGSGWQPDRPIQAAMSLAFSTGETQGPTDYVITFDGGAQGNPGPGYGSYALTRVSDGKSDVVRLDFGRSMTNNEAEYETLIAGLQALIERIEAAGRSPAVFSVEVRGDSALVIHQVQGDWKTKDERMRLLRNRVRELLARFEGYRLTLQARDELVRVLGH